jgi:hypothetical protein
MLCSVAALAFASQVWYGPVTVSFKVQFVGNPYDPEVNDVRVRFQSGKEKPIERLAYFDEVSGSWKATFAHTRPGEYTATLVRNGSALDAVSEPRKVVLDRAIPRGFLRRDRLHIRRLRWDDGTFYLPFGINLGWQGSDGLTVPDYLKRFGEAGLNWTRIWACHWDGKNLWWPNDKSIRIAPRQLWPDAIQKWDSIAQAAEQNGVGWQWTLFHHGPWSSRVNSNWGENPWSTANGGWLKTPGEFFTDPEAKARAKLYLRYVVARYAHHPHLIAWELFNEAEWVDPRYDGKWDVVREWHREMAEYLRSIDPYGRLVTTSSTLEEEGLYEHMDYLQPHLYGPEPGRAMAATHLDAAKPGFFGEFGTEGRTTPEQERAAIRDGVLWTVLAGHTGPGAYWYWDRVEREKLWPEFARLSEVLALAGIANRPEAHPIPLQAETTTRGVLRATPSIGWGRSLRNEFRLPEDAGTGAIPMSAYIQSLESGNAGLANGKPFTFHIRMPAPGKFRVILAQASRQGGILVLRGAGKEVRREFPGGERDRPVDGDLALDLPAGPFTVTLEGQGADWTRIAAVEVDGLAPTARVAGLGSGSWRVLRVVSTGPELAQVHLIGLGLETARYRVREFDLDAAQGTPPRTESVEAGTSLRWTPSARDVLLVMEGA